MISVVMAIYNEPIEWIKESIDSILNQTYKDFEFIIVNDNPERIENHQILECYSIKDGRINVIHNLTNLGLTKSLNIAVRLAKGEFIARMDADDVSMPERFEKQLSLMKSNPDCDYSGTDAILFSKLKIEGIRKTPLNNIQLANILFTSNPICHPSVIFRKKSINVYSLYDEECLKSQDYELWLRFLVEGKKYMGLPESLIKYRISDQQISSSQVNSQREYASLSKKKALSLYFNHIGLNRFERSQYLIQELHNCIKKERNLNYLDKIIIFYLCMSKNRNYYSNLKLVVKSIFEYRLRTKHIVILLLSTFTSRYNCYDISKEINEVFKQ